MGAPGLSDCQFCHCLLVVWILDRLVINNILTLALMNLIKAVSLCYRTYSGCLSLPYAKLPSCWRDNGQNDQKVFTWSIESVLCIKLSKATCMVASMVHASSQLWACHIWKFCVTIFRTVTKIRIACTPILESKLSAVIVH